MKYRVFWTPEAERELRDIVSKSADPTVVSAAAREIDRLLVADPHDVGESRVETARKGFVRPLGVDFEVLDDVATVIVFGVWRTDRRRKN